MNRQISEALLLLITTLILVNISTARAQGPADPAFSSREAIAQRLRSQLMSLERQLRATESRLRIINHAVDDADYKLNEHLSAARQFREDAELADSAEARRDAEIAVEQETLSSRIAVETIARLQLRQNSHEVQAGALNTALELARLKTGAVRGHLQFTRPELDEIQQRIAAGRTKVLDAASNDAGETESQGRQITWKLDILDIERDFWDALYTAFNPGGTAEAESALTRIRNLKARVDDWVEIIRLQAREPADEGIPAIGVRATESDVQRVVDLQHQLGFALEELGDEGVSGPGVTYTLMIRSLCGSSCRMPPTTRKRKST